MHYHVFVSGVTNPFLIKNDDVPKFEQAYQAYLSDPKAAVFTYQHGAEKITFRLDLIIYYKAMAHS